MNFVVGDVVRQGFGFANPNHAAAAICAAFPFFWGWGGAAGVRALPARGALQWCGRVAGVALCVMLAMTYSRGWRIRPDCHSKLPQEREFMIYCSA